MNEQSSVRIKTDYLQTASRPELRNFVKWHSIKLIVRYDYIKLFIKKRKKFKPANSFLWMHLKWMPPKGNV